VRMSPSKLFPVLVQPPSPLASRPAPSQRSLVRILLNDEPRDTEASTLGELLSSLGLAAEPGVAAALDGTVVARSAWGATPLPPGGSVLVIRAAQGG